LLLDLLAFTLVLLAPFVVLLNYHGYAYFRPEVLLIAGVAVAVAAVLALTVGLAGCVVRTVLLAVLVTLFIDLHVTLPRLPSIAVALAFLATAACVGSLLWLLREHAAKILSPIFVTLIALTLLIGKSGPHDITNEHGLAGSRSGGAPLLIHLVLDEHIGVEGLPPEIPGAVRLRTELIDFYTARGFRLFGGAYSQYANTFNALANLLNFAARDVSHPYLDQGSAERQWSLKEAAYFKMLQQRGYQLHVYQSTYMDLCHPKGLRSQNCTTYPVASLATIQDLSLRPYEKVHFIVNALLTRSNALRALSKVYQRRVRGTFERLGWHVPAWMPEPPSFGPLPAPMMLERLTADIVDNPRGHAFFAHLILPHYPYVFDSRCELRPRASDWLTNHIAQTDALVYNTADSRAQKYERYADQVRCVLTLLDRLLDTLDSRGLLDNATIIVHGDHGSRISEHFPTGANLHAGVLTETDYTDSFSTLYAIKAPGVPAGYVRQPASVLNLLDHYFSGEPLSEESRCRVFLIAEDAGRALASAEPKFCSDEVVTHSAAEEP
jgi:hypothetical protein